MQLEAIGKFHAPEPKYVRGQHFWIIAGMWKVTPPIGGKQILLDLENLVNIDGPGCYWCEEVWTPELAKSPCRGPNI